MLTVEAVTKRYGAFSAVTFSAASVNARDWRIMRGEPRVARLLDHKPFGR
jgi:hypothetical protein